MAVKRETFQAKNQAKNFKITSLQRKNEKKKRKKVLCIQNVTS